MWKKRFIDYLRNEKNYSSHTEISYLKDLTQFEEYVTQNIEDFDPTGIDSDIIRNWIYDLNTKGLKPRSINRKLSTLKTFFQFVLKKGGIAKNPAANITGLKTSKNLPQFISHHEMEKILDNKTAFGDDFEGVRDQFLLELFYTTGARRAEIAALKDSDINHTKKEILINGKRNKQRIVPISDNTYAKLMEYINKRDSEVENKSPNLFVRTDGRPLSSETMYIIINRHLDSITTITQKSPHTLRHSFATEMLNNGADITAVKELLGHASLASTEIYTHVTFEELKKAYNNAHPRAKN